MGWLVEIGGAPMSLYYEHHVKQVAKKKAEDAAKPRKTAGNNHTPSFIIINHVNVKLFSMVTIADVKKEKARKAELSRSLGAANVNVKELDWSTGIASTH
jgi:hypothetical protein